MHEVIDRALALHVERTGEELSVLHARSEVTPSRLTRGARLGTSLLNMVDQSEISGLLQASKSNSLLVYQR
jgi:hypothetical protein